MIALDILPLGKLPNGLVSLSFPLSFSTFHFLFPFIFSALSEQVRADAKKSFGDLKVWGSGVSITRQMSVKMPG